MALRLVLNGTEKTIDAIASDASLADFVITLGLRQDRVAVERNGEIVPRAEWAACALNDGDRLEVVHFVGGGYGPIAAA